jgi:hypothetical protein
VVTKEEAQQKATNPQVFGAPAVGTNLASAVSSRS